MNTRTTERIIWQNKNGQTHSILYEIFILATLNNSGGRLEVSRVKDKIWQDYRHRISEKDLEEYGSGNEVRWKNKVDWASNSLKNRGYLRKYPHVWEITKKENSYYLV